MAVVRKGVSIPVPRMGAVDRLTQVASQQNENWLEPISIQWGYCIDCFIRRTELPEGALGQRAT